MGHKINLQEKFSEYFHEPENYSFRSERFADELSNIVHNPSMTSVRRMEIMSKWLEAAFIQGARTMAQDTVDTLHDYGTALAGINDVVYNRTQAYDTAASNLAVYYTQILQDAENFQ